MKIKTIIKVMLHALALWPIANYCGQINNGSNPWDRLSINAAIGYLGGESQEYVYDESGSKLSQLSWKIKQAAIIKANIDYDLSNLITANLNGWTTFTKGQSVMDDYDWLNPTQSRWTDWSHHEDTDLNWANNLDLNLKGWILQNQNYKAGVTAGYQRNAFSFLAKGGCFQYNNGAITGCFPANEPSIGYKQIFNTFYLGLSGKYLVNNFEFTTTLKGSPWVNARDEDHHYMRNLIFKEDGSESNFYSAAISAGYYFTNSIKIFAEAAYNHFTNGKADTEIIDQEIGVLGYLNNAAGLSNYNYTLSIGVQYKPTALA